MALKDYLEEQRKIVINWMKDVRLVEKCQNVDGIKYLLHSFKAFDLSLLKQSTKSLPLMPNFIGVYVINLAINPQDQRFKNVLEAMIADNQYRLSIVNAISYFCGESNEITQHFIQLAIGYDNMNKPDSFLAVHQEMLKKQQDLVRHNQITLEKELCLNIAAIQEYATSKPIHVPVNVWNRLFEQLKALPEDDKQKLAEILQLPVVKLLPLQNTSVITELLDPLDSLKMRDRVSIYSLKLREILNKCSQNNDMGQFVQLLVNIQTCTTGKLNGIIHSYIFMNQGRELDERVIGKDAFKQEIVHFFKEELRRLREITLTDVLRKGLRFDQADPHDLHYLRGVIGGEIGLTQKDEILQIDMNSSGVNKILRSQTKQQLLDLFYQYYKVEDVVSRIHPLLNNGSIQISGSQNLTMSILNDYLQDTFDDGSETYRSEYVLLNDTGKPIGLMPAAAKKLLVLMGILEEKKQLRYHQIFP